MEQELKKESLEKESLEKKPIKKETVKKKKRKKKKIVKKRKKTNYNYHLIFFGKAVIIESLALSKLTNK